MASECSLINPYKEFHSAVTVPLILIASEKLGVVGSGPTSVDGGAAELPEPDPETDFDVEMGEIENVLPNTTIADPVILVIETDLMYVKDSTPFSFSTQFVG